MPEGVGYPPTQQAQQQGDPGMTAFDRIMMALMGREPQGAPQSGADELMMRQRGMQPGQQEGQGEAFQQLLQKGQQPTQPQAADPNMIQRALGSLFGGQ